MKKRFWETEEMFKRRIEKLDKKNEQYKNQLWRITAYDMKQVPNGGVISNGSADHFTIMASCKEMAIGKFKLSHMSWLVVAVEKETILT